MASKIIVKANALVQASYKHTSLSQMRLLMAAILQVKSKDQLSSDDEFTVTAGALADLTGTKLDANYKALARAADDLMNMYITIRGGANGKQKGKVLEKINVVSRCKYNEGEGTVSINFTPHILPYISSLTAQFTEIEARYVMPMRSAYGVRLYELCLQWIGFGDEREFEVEEFKRMLGLQDKYEKIYKLKDKVIFPALRDIDKYTDLTVKLGQRKRGRNVTHLQFKISKKKSVEKVSKAAGQGVNYFPKDPPREPVDPNRQPLVDKLNEDFAKQNKASKEKIKKLVGNHNDPSKHVFPNHQAAKEKE